MKIVMLSDPLLDDYGPSRPPILLAREFAKQHDVYIASVKMSKWMRERLEAYGIKPLDLNISFYSNDPSIMWLEASLREIFFKTNSRKLKVKLSLEKYKIISFTSIFTMASDISVGLGLITTTLNSVTNEMPWRYKLPSKIIKPLASYIDKKHSSLRNSSRMVIACSKYCADLYRKNGIKVRDVIYLPIDCDIYKSSTSKPLNNYVLSYIGKESKFPLTKKIADMGVEIKAFGAKLSYVPRYILDHPNIEILGHVTDNELISLYSNAYYTFFPFSDEVFGYIPLESMACETPVLTYARQGPGETVIDGLTGWLARNDDELVDLAWKLEYDGYADTMRKNCRKHSLKFDTKCIVKKWEKYLEEIL